MFLTESGAIIGTVAYTSPEHARGQKLDTRSDQFSLGVILYELATGRRPFLRDSAAETMTAIIREEPAPFPAGVPAPFQWIVERCLAKEPGERYESTRDLCGDLRARSSLTSDDARRELTSFARTSGGSSGRSAGVGPFCGVVDAGPAAAIPPGRRPVPGKRADLVLLEADPLADIRNTRRIAAVVVRGRLLSKPDIDRITSAHRRALPR
jgi:hypothetical protein